MGTSMYLSVEYARSTYPSDRTKPLPESTWLPVSFEPEGVMIARNYNLFSLLAGVRSDPVRLEQLFPARGLPAGVSTYTRDLLHEHGPHHMSWISQSDYEAYVRGTERSLDLYLEYLGSLYSGMFSPYRLVFGFDQP